MQHQQGLLGAAVGDAGRRGRSRPSRRPGRAARRRAPGARVCSSRSRGRSGSRGSTSVKLPIGADGLEHLLPRGHQQGVPGTDQLVHACGRRARDRPGHPHHRAPEPSRPSSRCSGRRCARLPRPPRRRGSAPRSAGCGPGSGSGSARTPAAPRRPPGRRRRRSRSGCGGPTGRRGRRRRRAPPQSVPGWRGHRGGRPGRSRTRRRRRRSTSPGRGWPRCRRRRRRRRSWRSASPRPPPPARSPRRAAAVHGTTDRPGTPPRSCRCGASVRSSRAAGHSSSPGTTNRMPSLRGAFELPRRIGRGEPLGEVLAQLSVGRLPAQAVQHGPRRPARGPGRSAAGRPAHRSWRAAPGPAARPR